MGAPTLSPKNAPRKIPRSPFKARAREIPRDRSLSLQQPPNRSGRSGPTPPSQPWPC